MPTTTSSHAAPTTDSQVAPLADDQSRALQRERLDAAILRSLGLRRAYRLSRTSPPCEAWDDLEEDVGRAATLLWELPDEPSTLCDDLLAFCAFVARELEVTEGMALTADEEWARLERLAPRAVAALDAICGELVQARVQSSPVMRALASTFGAIRAHFAVACVVPWRRAA